MLNRLVPEWVRQNWTHLALPAVALLSFWVGHLTAPARVLIREREKVVYQDRIVEKVVEVAASARTQRTAREIDRKKVISPDGTTTYVTRTRETFDQAESEMAKKTEIVAAERVVSAEVEHIRTVERSPDWRIGVLAAADLQRLAGPYAFGLHVERRILGPLSIGAFGLSSGVAGASLSMEF